MGVTPTRSCIYVFRKGKRASSRAVAIALDVTDQKRLEEQFRQAQKLEAIGRLAGGVAHDFNNLLTVINGFAELILSTSAAGPGVHDLATHIRDAGGRAADLTRQLLAFSRKQPAAAGPLDLATVVGGLCPLLAPLIGSEVRMVTRLNPVPQVCADKGQFEQVVMNLVVNARDAMPNGGTLTLTTDVVEVGAGDAADLPAGRWVVLLGRRYRHGNPRGRPGASLRAVLHDEGTRSRHRPRPVDGVWHREDGGRPASLRHCSGPRDDVPRLPAGGEGR